MQWLHVEGRWVRRLSKLKQTRLSSKMKSWKRICNILLYLYNICLRLLNLGRRLLHVNSVNYLKTCCTACEVDKIEKAGSRKINRHQTDESLFSIYLLWPISVQYPKLRISNNIKAYTHLHPCFKSYIQNRTFS